MLYRTGEFVRNLVLGLEYPKDNIEFITNEKEEIPLENCKFSHVNRNGTYVFIINEDSTILYNKSFMKELTNRDFLLDSFLTDDTKILQDHVDVFNSIRKKEIVCNNEYCFIDRPSNIFKACRYATELGEDWIIERRTSEYFLDNKIYIDFEKDEDNCKKEIQKGLNLNDTNNHKEWLKFFFNEKEIRKIIWEKKFNF